MTPLVLSGLCGLHPETIRTYLCLNKWGFFAHCMYATWSLGASQQEVLERAYLGFRLVQMDLGKDLKKWGFAMSGSAVRRRRYLDTFSLQGAKTRSRLTLIAGVTAVTRVSWRQEIFSHFCGLVLLCEEQGFLPWASSL